MGFANAQGLVNARLAEATGLRCLTTIPTDRPARFVRTIRTGGYLANGVTDVARLTFECWAQKKVDAQADAQQVRAAVLALRGVTLSGVKVHRVEEISAPMDSPDPDSSTPRYVLTHEVYLRGTYRKGQ